MIHLSKEIVKLLKRKHHFLFFKIKFLKFSHDNSIQQSNILNLITGFNHAHLFCLLLKYAKDLNTQAKVSKKKNCVKRHLRANVTF